MPSPHWRWNGECQKLPEVQREVTLSSNNGLSKGLVKCTDWILKWKGLSKRAERAVQRVASKLRYEWTDPLTAPFLPAAFSRPQAHPSRAFESKTHALARSRSLSLSLSRKVGKARGSVPSQRARAKQLAFVCGSEWGRGHPLVAAGRAPPLSVLRGAVRGGPLAPARVPRANQPAPRAWRCALRDAGGRRALGWGER